MAERKARHDRYAEIAAERAPKSLSLQEQAKAFAEPLENVENSIEFLARFRQRFHTESSDDERDSEGDESPSNSDKSELRGLGEHDYASNSRKEAAGTFSGPSVGRGGDDNNNNLFTKIDGGEDTLRRLQQQLHEQQQAEKRGRQRQRKKRDKKKRFEADLRRYDATVENLRRARKILDDRMTVIDIAHQHNWDVARRYVEKEKPVKNKHLGEAIAEA